MRKYQNQHSILSRIQTAFTSFLNLSLDSEIPQPSDLGVFPEGDSWCLVGLFLKTLEAGLSFDMGTTLPLPLTSLQGETERCHPD